ncbi:hypothetical protein GGTG_12024 [Gaeumannomyces tritici R3-111a-1]|uniref:Uncharacterized protein n=1 Tax=Gaeumannomyces tritici (strain R3-111a-1) TaxID=644352 RepID=J3PEU5_GAET3|nr:hypothetical protein GGTG_12024 [Gaeumannomyces tritici R3-111a-1]EJT71003.1 hypothetical protein GGTG_12024 [Gaeumannomyces tritici R3-111a-1]
MRDMPSASCTLCSIHGEDLGWHESQAKASLRAGQATNSGLQRVFVRRASRFWQTSMQPGGWVRMHGVDLLLTGVCAIPPSPSLAASKPSTLCRILIWPYAMGGASRVAPKDGLSGSDANETTRK